MERGIKMKAERENIQHINLKGLTAKEFTAIEQGLRLAREQIPVTSETAGQVLAEIEKIKKVEGVKL